MSELEEYQYEMARKRKAFAQARAVLQRSHSAGIPDKYMRIGRKRLKELIDYDYHNSDIVSEIYDSPDFLFKKPFIVIDGGSLFTRKEVGFAILFRMIACDKSGKFYDTSQLYTEFQSIRFGSELNRNDLVISLKNEEILFLNEFSPKKFSVHFESGNFFDQLLEYRDDYNKQTIITFSNQLESKTTNFGNAIKEDKCGAYFAYLSQSDLQNHKNVIRIRVK